MKALNSEIRFNRIIYFWLCYTGVIALIGISIYLNFRKIPELAQERNQASATEINIFLVETNRLDDYVRRLKVSGQSSADDLLDIFGFINQLRSHYDKPLFQSVLKSYEALIGDLSVSQNVQDDELKQLMVKYDQLLEEKKQLEQKYMELKQQQVSQ
jgi:hypothetical protein